MNAVANAGMAAAAMAASGMWLWHVTENRPRRLRRRGWTKRDERRAHRAHDRYKRKKEQVRKHG